MHPQTQDLLLCTLFANSWEGAGRDSPPPPRTPGCSPVDSPVTPHLNGSALCLHRQHLAGESESALCLEGSDFLGIPPPPNPKGRRAPALLPAEEEKHHFPRDCTLHARPPGCPHPPLLLTAWERASELRHQGDRDQLQMVAAKLSEVQYLAFSLSSQKMCAIPINSLLQR